MSGHSPKGDETTYPCPVKNCEEPRAEESSYCTTHYRFENLGYAIDHVDELRQPTPDEVMQADRDSIDRLVETIREVDR
jgi:hypothetical protein